MPDPDPLAPVVMVIHETELDAVQAHPEADVTVTVPVPAPAGADAAVGLAEYVQLAPVWDTLNVCPAIVSVPLRGDVDVLAATV